jgi:hypothetical protein
MTLIYFEASKSTCMSQISLAPSCPGIESVFRFFGTMLPVSVTTNRNILYWS